MSNRANKILKLAMEIIKKNSEAKGDTGESDVPDDDQHNINPKAPNEVPQSEDIISGSDFSDSGSEYVPRSNDISTDSETGERYTNVRLVYNNLSPQSSKCSNFKSLVPQSESPRTPKTQNSPGTPNTERPAWSPITPTFISNQTHDSPKTRRNVRKRGVHKELWKSAVSKKFYNEGLVHTNQSGRHIIGRKLGTPCKSNCKMKCSEQITQLDRENNYKQFWSLGSRYRQWNYIIKHVEETEKIRAILSPKLNRNCNRQYFLAKWNENTIIIKQRVCRLMFLNTLSINHQWITTAFKKNLAGNGTVERDLRGTYKRQANTTKLVMFDAIFNHIKSFPSIESHYCRKRSNRNYLDSSLSIAKMYRLFLEKMGESSISHDVTERQYRDILNQNFNLGFHVPKKDQCDVCISYDNLSQEEQEHQQSAQQQHLFNKTEARKLKELDKMEAQNNSEITVAVFDFQKILILPQSRASVFYYKRKYFVYNFTIYCLNNNTGYCFVWHETIGRRGGIEVSSCLKKFIEFYPNSKEFRFWSDNCPGQNRNRILFGFYSWASNHYNITIKHKYLEKGHTQNEGDSIHSCVERMAKHQEIFVPDQWYQLIKCAKTKSPQYVVTEMCQMDFFDFKTPTNGFNFQKNDNNEKLYTNKVKEIMINRENSKTLKYKYNFQEEFKTITVVKEVESKPRGRKSAKSTAATLNFDLKLAYTEPIPISAAKYKDFVELCNKNCIHSAYSSFYINIPHVTIDTNNNNNVFSSDEE